MASNYSPNNKRRRTADDSLHISDLPIGFIADVSAYLSNPSRALLAVAFTSPSLWQNDLMHRPSPISTAIISASQWDILDFEDVDKELANKLTDDDINAVLQSINAQDVLKRLKLCGCTNIIGHGLNSLRGSTVLEQIDLSLKRKYKVPKGLADFLRDSPQTKISEEAVVPILESIISANGCSLQYIQFPTTWSSDDINEGELNPLIELQRRFNALLRNRGLSCSYCNSNMSVHHVWLNGMLENRSICYECLDPVCDECYLFGNGMGHCTICKKKYCTGCVTVKRCTYCTDKYCEGCGEMEDCDECENATCDDCLYSCDVCNMNKCTDCSEYHDCDGCRKSHCADCYDGKDYSVKYCEECTSTFCSGCRLDQIKNNGFICNTCAPEENTKLKEEAG